MCSLIRVVLIIRTGRVDEMQDDAIEWTIRYNATFHTTLLRFLMPSIRAEGVPAFIVG